MDKGRRWSLVSQSSGYTTGTTDSPASLSVRLTHSLTHTHSYFHSLTHSLSHSLTHSHTHSHSLTHSLTHSHTHSHTHTHTLTHSHSHTNPLVHCTLSCLPVTSDHSYVAFIHSLDVLCCVLCTLVFSHITSIACRSCVRLSPHSLPLSFSLSSCSLILLKNISIIK